MSSRDEEEQTPLMIASREGHVAIVQLLLKDYSVCVDEVTTPPAVRNPAFDRLMKNPIVRKTAIRSGFKLNGTTALMLASQYGHASVVEILLAHGADINLQSTGSTALLSASAFGQEDCVRLLLAKGADLSLGNTQTGSTPLIMSSWNGHTNIVAILLEHGATPNVDKMTHSGNTSLHMALSLRRADTVELLLKHGADPNAINDQGYSALAFAVIKDKVLLPNKERLPAVPFHTTLLKYGAKVTPADFRTVVMFGGMGMARRLWGHRSFLARDVAIAKTE